MNNKSYTLPISGAFDAISARMKVRELARTRGLNITDQARISLAAYSLATALELGNKYPGRIIIDFLDSDNHTGLRVSCITDEATGKGFDPKALSNAKWLVDDLVIETLPSGQVQATVTQWSATRR
jgi:hypothetical protein